MKIITDPQRLSKLLLLQCYLKCRNIKIVIKFSWLQNLPKKKKPIKNNLQIKHKLNSKTNEMETNHISLA